VIVVIFLSARDGVLEVKTVEIVSLIEDLYVAWSSSVYRGCGLSFVIKFMS
jgi:hypothetical protein